jgi:hypothetical protein
MAQRVQVQDLPDAPGLQPTVRSGGQYSVAVQQAGSNKMMDLAASLSKINPILENYAGIARVETAIGQDEALKVADADVMDKIKGKGSSGGSLSQALGIENRNRAFRNTLIKRAVNNDLLPAMKAESDALLDVEKYKDNASFLQAVDDFTKKKWEDFSGQIGEEAASSDGASVVWNSITGPFKADMLAQYDKKKEDFIEYAQEEETGLELDAFTQKQIDPATGQVIPFDPAGLGKIAQNRENLMKEAGITDKKKRNVILLNSYARQVDALIAKGRYSDAERMLAAMSVIQVNGKPVFRTPAAKTVTTPLISKLSTAMKTAGTTNDADARREKTLKDKRFTNNAVDVIRNLRAVDTREEATENDIRDISAAFRRLGVPEDALNELVDQVFAGPSKPMTQFREVLRGVHTDYSDEVENRYVDTVDDIDEALARALSTPIRASALTPEDIEDETKLLQDYLEKNPGKTWNDFARVSNYKLPDEMKTFGDNFVKGNYVFNMDEYEGIYRQLDGRIDAIAFDKELEEEYSAAVRGDAQAFTQSNIVFINKRVERKAKEVADLPKEERDQAIRDEIESALDEEEARFQARVNARTSILRAELIATDSEGNTKFQRQTPSQIKAIEKGGVAKRNYIFSNDKDFKYPSLIAADKSDNPSVPQSVVDADRDKMIEKNQTEQLKRSLYRFGYTRWTPKSVDLMEKTNLDADDVRLFKDDAELRDIAFGWDELMRKDERGETLTEEEKETRALFNKLGIYNEETLQIFYSAQTALIGR